ncbi:Nif3-like dinuclear metal center hexameric protein [Deinococcus multiflagellatus]|uniref:Nif3-like dinuclear metal center hexameric protein n=1 Tax=Deinococcus multiflagellatus TaxID=1656887 RepID=A0ABW1ZF28_9DEIO|nr:Nif3-like dinuclear metal center hexameric protein [Deinococcus multiflagellatus]MBZ9712804.1 Nif3-like dinuclear metal center hexameric protein [Deinococcus multiflagellatus]
MSPATLSALAEWLQRRLDEPQPLKRPGPEAVTQLALALEPADLPARLAADALFVHRSRGVGEGWPGLGVLGAHDGFDLHLTTGPNRVLAARLGWTDGHVLTWAGQPAGLLATPPQTTWDDLRAALHAELGGEDASFPPAQAGAPLRVALMNRLNPETVALVAGAGAQVYLTGQVRPSAVPALQAAGLGLVALGHARTERWGLRELARELRAAFPGLQTTVHPGPSGEPEL